MLSTKIVIKNPTTNSSHYANVNKSQIGSSTQTEVWEATSETAGLPRSRDVIMDKVLQRSQELHCKLLTQVASPTEVL